MADHRSVSQYNSFNRCAYAYKLQRIDKVWQRPASWLSQGLGVHVALEEWERSGRTLSIEKLVELYQEEFARSIDEQAEDTPNFEFWFGSGPYRGPEDIERRFAVGEDQLRRMVAWAEDHPDQKPWVTPEGEPAIEFEFLVDLGGVPVKGFIDLIVDSPDGLIVRDYKTGARPGDIFQLATYAEAVRIKHGETPELGDYFMGKAGKPTKTIRITEQDREEVHKGFEQLEKDIQAEKFEPNPSRNVCAMCSVKDSCEFREG